MICLVPPKAGDGADSLVLSGELDNQGDANTNAFQAATTP